MARPHHSLAATVFVLVLITHFGALPIAGKSKDEHLVADQSSLSSHEATLVPTSDGFIATGSMPSGREFHGAELLVSGKVLIAGGSSFSPGPGYLYDPASGTFSSTGSMTVGPGRSSHTMTLLGTGKILVVGGSDPFNGGVTLNSAQLYDPSTNGFTATGNLTGARRDHTATLLPSGKVLLAAGAQGFTNLRTAELYTPASGTFAATGLLATARYAHIAAPLPGGKVLVAGGFGDAGVLTSAEIYDSTAGTWSPTGGLTTARYLAAAAVLADGRVLVVGGRGSGPSFPFLASAEIYDPAAGTFSPVGSMAAARVNHRTVLLGDGRVLVVGGGTTGGTVTPATPSSELFNPVTNSFSAGPPMITPRLFHTATRLADGRVLVTGGERPNQILSSSELFIPTPPVGPGSAVINEIAFDPDVSSPDPLRSHEWVEIYNRSGASIDLSGWRLTDRDGRNGGGARLLPSVLLPAGAYLTVHLAAGTNDLDFSDGCGQFYTSDPAGTDVFASAMDECALYGPDGTIDFVAWNHGEAGYVPGTAHNEAVAAGQWTSGSFLNTDRLTHSSAEKWRTVEIGTAIGRDGNSTDTDRPDDWDSDGGQDAVASTACAANRGSQPLLPVDDGPSPAQKAWTVMLYMVGDNDLEKNAFDDLKEIEHAGGSNASVNFVAMVDGGTILTQAIIDAQNNITLIESTRGHTWRFQIGAHVDNRYVLMHTHGYNPYLGERNMGSPAELTGFINWAKATYPAQRYALILWDHGLGWKSFGVDLNQKVSGPRDDLYMGELRTALAGQLFELLGFDACLMAMIEVADQLQPFARYMVASEEMIAKTGWPYDQWVPLLRNSPAMDGAQLGTKIVEEFDKYYMHPPGGAPPRDSTATLSCVQMSGVPALVGAVSAFADDLTTGSDDFMAHDAPADNVEARIRDDAAAATRFADNNFMDLRHFALLVQADGGIPLSPDQCYKANLPPVISQTANPGPVIVAEKHGTSRGAAAGLSIHFPLTRTSSQDGSAGMTCEAAATNAYDCPSDSRETNWPSRRAAYATNVDCLPFLAEDVEMGDALAAPANWTMVPSPNLRFVIDTHWDEFLQRFYHPVADNHITHAVCPDAGTIYPVIVDPACGNPVDEITILPGCEVFFHANGSSDADTTNRLPTHWMWDFDHATSGCAACIAPYEVSTGADASMADDDMNAEHDCSKAPLTDEKQADATMTSRVFTEIRDYIVTLHAWDDNHLFKRHNTSPNDDHVHPQTDDHLSIVHVVYQHSIPGPAQNLGVNGVLVTWNALAVATSYDLVKGDLRSLRLTAGNFTTSLTGCLEDNGSDLQATDHSVPASPGDGFYYLVRGVNDLGQPGTYDSGLPGQVDSRDAELRASPLTCP